MEKQCKPHEGESVDFSQGTLEAYNSFTEKAFKKCETILSEKSVSAEKRFNTNVGFYTKHCQSVLILISQLKMAYLNMP